MFLFQIVHILKAENISIDISFAEKVIVPDQAKFWSLELTNSKGIEIDQPFGEDHIEFDRLGLVKSFATDICVGVETLNIEDSIVHSIRNSKINFFLKIISSTVNILENIEVSRNMTMREKSIDSMSNLSFYGEVLIENVEIDAIEQNGTSFYNNGNLSYVNISEISKNGVFIDGLLTITNSKVNYLYPSSFIFGRNGALILINSILSDSNHSLKLRKHPKTVKNDTNPLDFILIKIKFVKWIIVVSTISGLILGISLSFLFYMIKPREIFQTNATNDDFQYDLPLSQRNVTSIPNEDDGDVYEQLMADGQTNKNCCAISFCIKSNNDSYDENGYEDVEMLTLSRPCIQEQPIPLNNIQSKTPQSVPKRFSIGLPLRANFKTKFPPPPKPPNL